MQINGGRRTVRDAVAKQKQPIFRRRSVFAYASTGCILLLSPSRPDSAGRFAYLLLSHRDLVRREVLVTVVHSLNLLPSRPTASCAKRRQVAAYGHEAPTYVADALAIASPELRYCLEVRR